MLEERLAAALLAVMIVACGSESATGPGGNVGGTGGTGGSGGSGASSGSSGTGGQPMPPPECKATTPSHDSTEAAYGFATDPPTMVLGDTFYTYDLRTNIGSCSTDQVEWHFDTAPANARLELVGAGQLAPGESVVHDQGGEAREHAKLAWDLEGVSPGCYDFVVRWRAWLDCGALDSGKWGEEVVQSFSVAVRENHWLSGDLHVHTKHSERGEEAGSAWDYYSRMVNLTQNDAGKDFADRRFRSLRGRLHWLVFSDHTNNEQEECGRVFSEWCETGAAIDQATGREIDRQITEQDPSVLLVPGSEISNKWGGHFGFLPKNPFPGHPQYAPGYDKDPTQYDFDVGYGTGIFPERWVEPASTNQEQLDLIRKLGAFSIVNHETMLAPWVSYDWSSQDFDGLEVWNGGFRHDRFDDDAYHGGIDLNSVAEQNQLGTTMPETPIEDSWLGQLKKGRFPVILVGGSDVHDYNEVVCFNGPCDPTNSELAVPTTSVWAPSFVWTNGVDGIVDGIARGRVVVHDLSNFIDLRVVYHGLEYMVGDTIDGYVVGEPLTLRAFGRVANFVDGDNRVVLIYGTAMGVADDSVRVLYNSEDEKHFVQLLKTKDHMRYIHPDANFDRQIEVSLSAQDLGADGVFYIVSQFIPFHNPIYVLGNGQDMAVTGAVRIRAAP